jgi:hypothetical protein
MNLLIYFVVWTMWQAHVVETTSTNSLRGAEKKATKLISNRCIRYFPLVFRLTFQIQEIENRQFFLGRDVFIFRKLHKN